MRLRPTDQSGPDDTNDVQPTFTPAARQPADDTLPADILPGDALPDDVAAQTPTVVENYPADATAEPAADYADDSDYATETNDTDDTDSGDYARDTDVPLRSTTVETYQETARPAVASTVPAAAETAAFGTAPASVAGVTLAAPATGTTATPAAAVPAPAAGANLDQPLLAGDTELVSQWQRVQAEFVDDPQVAVAGAADLVEQAGQALVEALQQRQRQMRTVWDHSGSDGSAAPGDTAADTEQLRQMMHRYRALFNQLYQPV